MCINQEHTAGHMENYDKIELITNMHQEPKYVFIFYL